MHFANAVVFVVVRWLSIGNSTGACMGGGNYLSLVCLRDVCRQQASSSRRRNGKVARRILPNVSVSYVITS